MFRNNATSVEQISCIVRSSDVRSSSFAEQAMWKNVETLRRFLGSLSISMAGHMVKMSDDRAVKEPDGIRRREDQNRGG